jgi:nucleotide-binding universal stress UspA family protein
MPHRRRFTSIAVAVDSTPQTALAVSRTAWLALEREATIHLVHPVPEPIPAAARGAIMEGAARTLARMSEEIRDRVRSRGQPDIGVESTAVPGRPYVEIIRHARARGADLVVIGRSDALGRRGGVDESTVERVVRKSDIPTLLVHREAEGPYRRALLAIDLSDVSLRVGELALALLPAEVDALRVVHTFNVPFADWFGAETLDALRRDYHDSARAAMRRVEAIFQAFDIECREVLREGEARTGLLREAAITRSDLIVLGTHGRSGVAHALLGSVAEWVVRTAPCDVAVTRPARYTFELP